MKALNFVAACGFALAVCAPFAPALAADTTVPRADANGTGNVTLAEYQKSRMTFILKADTNKDGKVSKAEWDTFTKAVRRDLELGQVKGAELIGQGSWWDLLDANKDGVVTQTEINTVTKAKFAQYDADHNSLISRAEAEQVRKSAALH